MRYKITIVDRIQWHRRPRSKKLRIRRKWRKNPKNWRPNPRIFHTTVILGSLAGENYLEKARESPYFNPSTPFSPNEWQMHSVTWERIKEEIPEFVEKCDVFHQPTFQWPYPSPNA